ncbi:hypothetical protein [Pseudomonas sp. Marseille-Q8238]
MNCYNDASGYMDNVKKEGALFYAIFEADLAPRTLATLGFTYQKDRNSDYDWSALPTRADGSLASRSSCSADGMSWWWVPPFVRTISMVHYSRLIRMGGRSTCPVRLLRSL